MGGHAAPKAWGRVWVGPVALAGVAVRLAWRAPGAGPSSSGPGACRVTRRYDCPICGRRVKLTHKDYLHTWGLHTVTLVAQHGPDASPCSASGREPSNVTREAAMAAKEARHGR